jgi:hypothetical protein
MTITDRISTALVEVIGNLTLPGDPVVTGQIELAENEEENVRVIVAATNANLRSPLLPGNYDIIGEVTIFKTIDQQDDQAEDLKGEFRELCDALEEIIGMKPIMRTFLESADPQLHIYSWTLTGQESFMQSRAMGAKFTWTAYARQDPHNPN